MNKLTVFSAIVIILGGECFHGINAEEFCIETTNVMYSINIIINYVITYFEVYTHQVLISYSKIKQRVVLIRKITNTTFKFVKKKILSNNYFSVLKNN